MNEHKRLIELFDKIAVLFNFTAEEVGKAHKANTQRLKRIMRSMVKQLSEADLKALTGEDVVYMQNELGLETRESILDNKLNPNIEDIIAEVLLLQHAMTFTIESILKQLAMRCKVTDEVRDEVRHAIDLLASRRVGAITTSDGCTYKLNLTNRI